MTTRLHDTPDTSLKGCLLLKFPTLYDNKYVTLQLRVQNVVSAQPCVGKFGISLVLLNFLHCNFSFFLFQFVYIVHYVVLINV